MKTTLNDLSSNLVNQAIILIQNIDENTTDKTSLNLKEAVLNSSLSDEQHEANTLDMLNDCFNKIDILGVEYKMGEVLKEIDPSRFKDLLAEEIRNKIRNDEYFEDEDGNLYDYNDLGSIFIDDLEIETDDDLIDLIRLLKNNVKVSQFEEYKEVKADRSKLELFNMFNNCNLEVIKE